MKKRSPDLLRQALSALAVTLLLAPAAARAADGDVGDFRPTASTVLDADRRVFSFTDIVIPSGVVVSFSGLASGQQIVLRASGIIDIAGTLDVGAGQLRLETPASVSFSESASIVTAGLGRLTIAASATPGASVLAGGDLALRPGGSIVLIGSDPLLPGFDATLSLPGAIVIAPAKLIATPRVDLIVSGGELDITRVSAVPEPDSATLLLAGSGLLVGALRRRRPRVDAV